MTCYMVLPAVGSSEKRVGRPVLLVSSPPPEHPGCGKLMHKQLLAADQGKVLSSGQYCRMVCSPYEALWRNMT